MSKTNPTPEELFNFPCDYPIKIFGRDNSVLQDTICKIIEKHTDKLHPNQIQCRKSSKGNFVAFTIRIIATSKSQIDSINQDLQDCELVEYVL
jgi:putative lipoic acid-binding regulatory protein